MLTADFDQLTRVDQLTSLTVLSDADTWRRVLSLSRIRVSLSHSSPSLVTAAAVVAAFSSPATLLRSAGSWWRKVELDAQGAENVNGGVAEARCRG